jgi:hypothetical protein
MDGDHVTRLSHIIQDEFLVGRAWTMEQSNDGPWLVWMGNEHGHGDGWMDGLEDNNYITP